MSSQVINNHFGFRNANLSLFHFAIRISQFAIPAVNGWPTPAALVQESNASLSFLWLLPTASVPRGVAGHVFKSTPRWRFPLIFKPSLRPFRHQVLSEAGAGQPFSFNLQRSFELS